LFLYKFAETGVAEIAASSKQLAILDTTEEEGEKEPETSITMRGQLGVIDLVADRIDRRHINV